MNVNDMYRICQYAINKAQNGYLTSSEFNLLAEQAQVSYTDYLVGEFQQYQYGRPQARISYSENSNIRQRITPLLNITTLSIDGTGFAAYPTGYLQTDSMIKIANFSRVRFVEQDRLYSYMNSTIDPISSNPIYMLVKDGFQFYPINSSTATLSYLKTPPLIVWGYTLDGNGRQVYSAGSSTQPVWGDLDLLDIISRILKLVGVNLQNGQIEQYANQVTQMGQ